MKIGGMKRGLTQGEREEIVREAVRSIGRRKHLVMVKVVKLREGPGRAVDEASSRMNAPCSPVSSSSGSRF